MYFNLSRSPHATPKNCLPGITREIRFQTAVKKAIAGIDIQRMKDFVQEFTSFQNRFHDSNPGLQSSEYLLKLGEGV